MLIGHSHEHNKVKLWKKGKGLRKPEGQIVTIPQPSSEFIHKGKWHERRTKKTEDDVMKTLSCVKDIVQFVYKIHRRTRLCGTSRGRAAEVDHSKYETTPRSARLQGPNNINRDTRKDIPYDWQINEWSTMLHVEFTQTLASFARSAVLD